jgi:hypothetical protein
MLPGVDARGTGAVVRVEATSAVARIADVRSETADRFERIAVGTAFQAQVLSRLADNSFLVRVGDADLHMPLPQGTQTGDRLQLTLAGATPRPTFYLALPAAAQAEPAAVLSSTGRLIDQILHSLPDSAASTPLRGAMPLVASPDAGAPRLAAALQGALEQSGMFYESHVALWAEGAWPMSSLQKEPQAQAGHFLLTSYQPTAAPGLPMPAGANAGPAVPSTADATHGDSSGSDRVPGAAASAAGNPVDAPRQAIFDADTARLIGQQLGALEQGQVRWQGECWPGQRMEWQVQEDSGGNTGANADARRIWDSTLLLELPRLGKVSATIHLSGNSVRMQLQVADPAAAQELRQGGAALADAVAASGSRLDQLAVSQVDLDKTP